MWFADSEIAELIIKYERDENTLFELFEYEEIISFYIDNYNTKQADKVLSQALIFYPNEPSLVVFKIEIFIVEDKLAQAEEILLKALQSQGANVADLLVAKSYILSQRNEHKKAIETLLHTTESLIFSKDKVKKAMVYSFMGREFLFQNDYFNAVLCYRKAFNYCPDDYSYMERIISCYTISAETEKAVAFLEEVLQDHPLNEVAWFELGKIYTQNEETYSKALECFDFAIASDETFSGAYYHKARLFQKMKKYVQAIQDYKIILTLEDPSPLVLLNIGECYKALKDYKWAEFYIKKSIYEDPQFGQAWLSLAELNIILDDKNYVNLCLNKIISCDENYHHWVKFAEISLSYLQDTDLAISGFKHCFDLGCNNIQVLEQYAAILSQKNTPKEAFEMIQKYQENFDLNKEYPYLAIVFGFKAQKQEEIKIFLNQISGGDYLYQNYSQKYPEIFSSDFVKKHTK